MVIFSFVAGFALSEVSAQTFTINGQSGTTVAEPGMTTPAVSGNVTVRDAQDFASQVLGDPWDFEQASDYVFMYSGGWAGVPSVANGQFTGLADSDGSVSTMPMIQLMFEGIGGGLNTVGKIGYVYPIDARKYKRLAFRMRRNQAPATTDTFEGVWFHDSCRVGCGYGGRIAYTYGFDPGTRQYIDQSPRSGRSQPVTTGTGSFHLYRMDLDGAGFAGLTYSQPWELTGTVRGIALRLGEGGQAPGSMSGATFEVDWVRLVPRGAETTVDLAWSSLGAPVTLTARHAETGDVVQIYPDDGTDATTFADNRTFLWDYGYLPPGTWTLTAQGSTRAATPVTLRIDPAPVVNVTDPDVSGGLDVARTLIGDAWDLTNAEDTARFGKLYNLTGASYGPGGLTAASVSGAGAADPVVALVDDSPRPPSQQFHIDANTWHRLTFTVELDHKELDGHTNLLPPWGGMTRVIWREANNNGGALTQTSGIIVLDGGPNTYSIDMAALRTFCGPADWIRPDCDLEGSPGAGTRTWAGPMGVFRIDPHEGQNPRVLRVADVRLAADDAPNGNGFFTIRWSVADATFSRAVAGGAGGDAYVNIYWDNNTNRNDGRIGITSMPASAGRYVWDTTGLQANTLYWISIDITDSAGNTQTRYSTGPVHTLAAPPVNTDGDGDGMADAWEARFSLTDPAGDADADGVNNVDEYRTGTNPLLPNTWNLPEGATGFFNERIALANPEPEPATVTVTYLREGAPPIVKDYAVGGRSRLTIDVNAVEGMGAVPVSAVITANAGGVLAERTMFWGDGWYGGHTGKAMQTAQTVWYLAEGAQGYFDEFILLANATDQNATVTIDYLLETGATLTESYVVEAKKRRTVYANDVLNPVRGDPAYKGPLWNQSFSAKITSNIPITVERAMYFTNAGRFWNGGHEVAAVAQPSTTWFVAEGRTGPSFDMYLLLANPNAAPADATIRYLKPGGEVVTQVFSGPNQLPARSRRTIWVDSLAGLTDTEVSASITSTLPIIVERAMYWPDTSQGWIEAHASAGVTSTGTKWVLAEGEAGGPRGFESYFLVANPSGAPANVSLTALRASGPPITIAFTVPANSRGTRSNFDFPGLGSGEQFGLLIESTNGVPIVVERAMYWNGGGQFWGGGSNETGFKLR